LETSLAALKKGQRATIINFDVDAIPLKLIEMGCLPGNLVEMIQAAPLGDPLYINVNDSHLAIRRETASEIIVEVSE
jgi:ferrous iron transport protein A